MMFLYGQCIHWENTKKPWCYAYKYQKNQIICDSCSIEIDNCCVKRDNCSELKNIICIVEIYNCSVKLDDCSVERNRWL